MSDADDGVALAPTSSREYHVVLLVIACVAAVALAAALVPIALSGGVADAPAASLVPILGESGDGATDGSGVPGPPGSGVSGSFGSGGGGGLGALNVGREQSVGGTIAEDDGGNPFRSQDTAVHFTVRSSHSDYWRTGAYDTYTGEGWRRSGPSDATVAVEDREVSYEVELAATARAAPSVWRPVSIDGPEPVELRNGLARGTEPLSAGTSYEGVSRKPPRDPSILGASGRDYPDDVERRYTDLPAGTRAELTPFTRNLTSEADSPYETARRVEQWLETTKDYSLEVDEPPDEDVAAQFVFEMDRGYCEYFATSMVAMLRSQDVPARYAVGYSTGERVDNHTYRVRAMNAHAWVEVYFADVGWVRFDPTPGGERLQRERQSFEEGNEPGTYEPREEGSPGETFAPNRSGDPATPGPPPDDGQPGEPSPPDPSDPPSETTPVAPTPDETPDDPSTETPTPDEPGGETEPGDPDEQPDDAVELNRTAVPGATVEASVTRGGGPVVGATVRFNGEPIGQTDADGTVVGTVPYARTLDVSVEGGDTLGLDAEQAADGSASLAPVRSAGAPAPGSGGPAFKVREPDPALVLPSGAGTATDAPAGSQDPPAAIDRSDRARQAGNATESFELSTAANLSVSGSVRTDAEVVVTATVDDVPVRNTAVTLDGNRVARTDERGRARVRLPASPGNATLAVERGPVSGERTLRLASLSASVEPVGPLPIAGLPAEVTATLGDEPVAGAPVAVGGEAVGETDVDGSVSVALPADSSVPVAVGSDGQTARTVVENPLVNAAALAGALVALICAAGVALHRRPAGAGSATAWLARAIGRVYRGVVRVLVGSALALERAWTALVARLRRGLAAGRAVLAGRRSPGEVASAIGAWLVAALGRLRRRTRSAADRSAGSGAQDEANGAVADAYVTIREAWARFLDRVSTRRTRTMTPGQIASHAVSVDGLPADAVRTLRDEFRAVEYGPRSPDDAVPAVASALRRIETAGSDEDDQTAGDAAGAEEGASPAAVGSDEVGAGSADVGTDETSEDHGRSSTDEAGGDADRRPAESATEGDDD